MRFWDSSALLPLISEETFSGTVAHILREDEGVAAWWGSWTECAVAISRLRREDKLDEEGEERTRAVLDQFARDWTEVHPEDDMRLLASIISKYYPLKAADCLQLAAALRWCEVDTNGTGFVCLDERLRRAAPEEGFDVLPTEEDAA